MYNHTRRQFLRTVGAAIVSVGLPPSWLARAAGTDSTTPKRGGVLIVGQDDNPLGLDSHKTAAFATNNIVEHVYTCLLRWDKTSTKVQPDLAVSWENPDPQTFVFHLRDNVKFHDGQPLTSGDVKFTFQRLVDPETMSPWKTIFDVIGSIDTPDPKTVVFHLKRPFSPFLNYLATQKYSAIVSAADVKHRGDLVEGGFGTGPFMIERFVPDSLVRLKRNPYYYEQGLPYLDGLDFRIIPSEASRMAALRSRSVDLTWLTSPDSVEQMRGVSNMVIPPQQASWRLLLLEFDTRRPPFNDVRVRRAFSLAVNREQIIKIVFRGRAELAAALPPAQVPFAISGEEVLELPYIKEDLVAARKLMADAGYANGFDTIFAVCPANFGDVPTAEIIQQQVRRIGIRIKIVQKEWGTLVSDFQRTLSPMSMAGLVWGPDPDTNITIRLDSDSLVHPGKESDPVLDDLLAEARQTYDISKRVSLYRSVQERVADMAHVINPAAMQMRWEIWRSNVNGYQVMPNAQRVYLRQAWLS